jgi:hypothetical protein
MACAIGLLPVLASCAQTSHLIGVSTGSIDSAAQIAQPGGLPPLPARRTPAKPPESVGFLAALSDVSLSGRVAAPTQVVAEGSPVAVYTTVAREIRRCWLAPVNPKLDGHGFRAAAPSDGQPIKIDIFQEVPDRKLGPLAFRIDIVAQAGGTLVTSRNVRLTDALADEFKGDMARWVKGDMTCRIASRPQ